MDVGRGKVVQVDPIKPNLKPPGTRHLKVKCDTLISTFAFKFNLRRYNVDRQTRALRGQGLTLVHFSSQLEPSLTHKNTLFSINTPLTRATQSLRAPPVP